MVIFKFSKPPTRWAHPGPGIESEKAGYIINFSSYTSGALASLRFMTIMKTKKINQVLQKTNWGVRVGAFPKALESCSARIAMYNWE